MDFLSFWSLLFAVNISLNESLHIVTSRAAQTNVCLPWSTLFLRNLERNMLSTLWGASLHSITWPYLEDYGGYTTSLVHFTEPQRAANQFFKAPTGLTCWGYAWCLLFFWILPDSPVIQKGSRRMCKPGYSQVCIRYSCRVQGSSRLALLSTSSPLAAEHPLRHNQTD